MRDRSLVIEPGTPTTFQHDSSLFYLRVWGEGLLSLGVAAYSVYKLVTQQMANPLWLIPLVVAGYTFHRLLLRGGAPRTVVINADAIELRAPNGTRIHKYSELKEFRVRQFSAAKTLYLQVESSTEDKQKCWIEWTVYSDSADLLDGLLKIENMIHPDSLKERVRTQQERYARVRRRPRK